MKHVLIIEDDHWLAEGYGDTLKSSGHVVHVAHSAQAGIEQVDQNKVDIILLDMFLPGGNGLQFLQELRSYADTMHVPVIVCSSAAQGFTAASLAQYGVVTVLDKATLTPARLRQAIDEVAIA